MKRHVERLLGLGVLIFAVTVNSAERHPMKFDDLAGCTRVSDPQISPDGKWVVYVSGSVDKDANKIPASLWIAPANGSEHPRRLTNAAGRKDGHPRWSPDGKSILFQSNRSGDSQLWMISLEGGEARQLTSLST